MKVQIKIQKTTAYKALALTCALATLFGASAQAVTKKLEHQEQNTIKSRMHPADKQKVDDILKNSSEYSFSSKTLTDANGNKHFSDMEEIQINFRFICDKKISIIRGNGGRIVNNCILKPIPSSTVTVALNSNENTESGTSKSQNENILATSSQLKLKNYCQLDGVIKSSSSLLSKDLQNLSSPFQNTIRSCAQETFELVKRIRAKNEVTTPIQTGKIYFENSNTEEILRQFNKALSEEVSDMRDRDDGSFYDMNSSQDIGFKLTCDSKENHFARSCWFEIIDKVKFAKKNLTKPIDPHLLNENGFIDLNMKCHLNNDYSIMKLMDNRSDTINQSVINSLKSCAKTYFKYVNFLKLEAEEEY